MSTCARAPLYALDKERGVHYHVPSRRVRKYTLFLFYRVVLPSLRRYGRADAYGSSRKESRGRLCFCFYF